MKKRKFRKYDEYLIESLKDPKKAAEYLNAALEEGDRQLFLLALKDVATASGGFVKLSKKTKLNRENLYRILSKKGNPALDSLNNILKKLGLRFAVEVAV